MATIKLKFGETFKSKHCLFCGDIAQITVHGIDMCHDCFELELFGNEESKDDIV